MHHQDTQAHDWLIKQSSIASQAYSRSRQEYDLEQIVTNIITSFNSSHNQKQQESAMRCAFHQHVTPSRRRHQQYYTETTSMINTRFTHWPIHGARNTSHQKLNRHVPSLIPQIIANLTQICCLSMILVVLIGAVSSIVVYQVKFIASESGRTDYVLAGESVELSCHYAMKDDAEDVKQVTWSKDGKNFLRWRKNRLGLEVLSYTYKGHIDQSSTFSHVIIHNVSIEMHGKYKCSIKTDLGTHTGDMDLVIISGQQCKYNDWRIHSEQTKCRELLRFDCRNMFPKPVPSCGLWDNKMNKFIRSVAVDISEESLVGVAMSGIQSNTSSGNGQHPGAPANSKETYRVRYSDKFALKFSNGSSNPQHLDLLQYAGHLVFKCDILVPDTSWKLSLTYKMFDYQDGCNQDPLEAIEQMRSNFSHYATLRMQQAGYLALNRQRQLKQNDDIEMLTTSLKYEIIPPSHFITNGQNNLMDKSISSHFFGNNKTTRHQNNTQTKFDNILDFNCWQKPRIGSLARLSCVNQSPKNPVKLIGANLLECRPNGWMPIKSSISSLSESSVTRKQQVFEKKNSATLPTSRRPTRAERPDGRVLVTGSIDPNRTEGSDATNPTRPNAAIRGHDNQEDDDGDDDDSSSHMISSNNEVEGLTRSRNVPTIVRDPLEEKIRYENEISNSDYDQLTPAELASLLPACVSIAPAKPRKQQSRPLIEASTSGDGKFLSKSGRIRNNVDNWDWYIFSPNSAAISAWQNFYQRSLMILMAIAAIFFIVN